MCSVFSPNLPFADRYLCDFVVALLLCHSLEEADTLCDRIAILSHGKLMCIGKPEELKLRLGMGHHLNVSLPENKIGELHDAILEVSEDAKIDTQLAGNVEYVLPKSVPLSSIFSFVESHRGALRIKDWAISQSTLEDVFLSVTKKAADALKKREDV